MKGWASLTRYPFDVKTPARPAMRRAPCKASSATFRFTTSISAWLGRLIAAFNSLMPKSSKALNRIIHITWYVASLAQDDTAYRRQKTSASALVRYIKLNSQKQSPIRPRNCWGHRRDLDIHLSIRSAHVRMCIDYQMGCHQNRWQAARAVLTSGAPFVRVNARPDSIPITKAI